MCIQNGGVPISASELVELASVASKRVTEIFAIMTDALNLADTTYRKVCGSGVVCILDICSKLGEKAFAKPNDWWDCFVRYGA